jgi:hypothetical protein
MTRRKAFANLAGYAGILCSFAFWLEVCVARVVGYTPGWLDMGGKGWFMGWMLGVVLAVTAVALGSRKWAYAAILPFISFFAAVASIDWSHVQW